uniref:OSJNBa0095H06.1 protein n=1 Tax=Oryza sativa subsp. japonica TaxID=39947 RepID=Q7XRN8_ORYSJ|nr:OSJNBa0095H06.1 [Oryza sativa Japonica Group]CAE02394.2 OSJNBb0080H08.22 [Oryza sativa Japonica Group]
MAQDAGDAVLPALRITAERHLSLIRKIMPEDAAVRVGESRLRPRFFHEVLDFYEIHAFHLAPNVVMTLAILAHLCEMFIGVRPTMRQFLSFFVPWLLQGAVVGGCCFQPRPGTAGQYIESHLCKKWEDWKKDWFYTALPDHPRLRLPAGPPERSATWLVVSELGEEYDAVRDRLRGLRSQGLTGAMVFGDYFRRRIAPLQERSRGAWEYTSFRDRESILAVMSAVGAGRGRSRRGGAGGGAVGAGSSSASAGGSRTGNSGGDGDFRAPGPSRGPGGDSAGDPKGKRKMFESRPPSPPRGGGAERVADRPPAGHKRPAASEAGRKKKRLRKIGQTEPCRGSFIEPPKWTFKRPPSQGRSRGCDLRGAPLGGGGRSDRGPEAEVERAPGAEAGRDPEAEAGGGPEPEVEVEAESARGPEAGVLAAADSIVWEGLNAQVQALADERAALEAEWAQLAADRARVDEGRRAVDDMVEVGHKMRQAQPAEIQAREETLDSVMRETEEERQAALIASSVLDEALGDIRLQYETHAEDLAKRVEDTRGVLDAAAAQERRASEVDASLRAQSAALEAERKVLDERARSAQEFEATIHRRIEVLDRNQREQDERSWKQAQQARELEEHARALEEHTRALEERARMLDQCETTLAAHERTAAEAESSLRLREEAAAERNRTTLAVEASVAHRAEELRLREEACQERDATLAVREAEENRRGVAARWLGEQLAKREEAVTGHEARHLESARAEREAMATRSSELEAQEKELEVGGQLAGAELVSQLTAAQSTLADLGRLVQDQVGEITALRLTNEIGPGQLSDAVDRLGRAGRRIGISVRQDRKLPPTQPAVVLRLDGMAADLERLEEEVGETVKSSSALAQAMVELVLASHQARDNDFLPWRALEDFPPGT